MIPNIVRGSDPAGLVRYLFGKGRRNEHTDQHLVCASGDMFPSFDMDGRPAASYAEIGRRFDRRYRVRERKDDPFPPDMRGKNNPEREHGRKRVWHCSLAIKAGQGILTDQEWEAVIRDYLTRMNIIDGDDDQASHGSRSATDCPPTATTTCTSWCSSPPTTDGSTRTTTGSTRRDHAGGWRRRAPNWSGSHAPIPARASAGSTGNGGNGPNGRRGTSTATSGMGGVGRQSEEPARHGGRRLHDAAPVCRPDRGGVRQGVAQRGRVHTPRAQGRLLHRPQAAQGNRQRLVHRPRPGGRLPDHVA